MPDTRGAGVRVHARSEVTRLLCAAAYTDRGFRNGVIKELVEHPERSVAPSLGFDAVPVLRHCLRARRMEATAALRVIGSWVVLWLTVLLLFVILVSVPGAMNGLWEDITLGMSLGVYIGGRLVLGFAVFTWLSRFLTGRSTALYLEDTAERRRTRGIFAVLGVLLRWAVRLCAVTTVLAVLVALVAQPFIQSSPSEPAPLFFGVLGVIVVFLMVTWVAAWYRTAVESVLTTELSERRFTGTGPEVDAKYAPLLDMIAREQHSRVVVYDTARPFRGAGNAFDAWSLPLELRAADGRQPTGGLDGRFVTDLVRRELESLTTSDTGAGLDRLKGMEITECVFLPGPLPLGYTRGQLPVGCEDASEHIDEAVNEGAEQRRHFLRVRIGGWEEHVVTTIYVRAHAHRGMLLLEVVPHVLAPLDDRFLAADAIAEAAPLGPGQGARRLLSALFSGPAASLIACVSLIQTGASLVRTRLNRPDGNRVEGPRASIRERAAGGGLSLFQEMDVARYVKTVEERMAKGVRKALLDAGYETDEFQRRIVNISGGGVFVGGSVSGGAIATGQGSLARSGGTHGRERDSD
ncbi:hypothetical protein KIK06_19215 [Nocardiopsis sp. EMB25]|uniref:hypothetical protein n=1 Tax=Nocardiopsis sp. EMB25 TaxID=2835867 RepID=UPI0022837FA3|nr:hypothetical protein [Nocardiopsis sp. EMB25]MCY9786024.1 hypothetical protein [Nocardiopsis sp. EMB25]